MTTTQNFVQASARVVTITELAEGDVYQRLIESPHSNDQLRFGLVTSVLNNGQDVVIQAMEIKEDYSGIKPEIVTFGTNKEVSIFPADRNALAVHLEEARKSSERSLDSAQKSLVTAERNHANVMAILNRHWLPAEKPKLAKRGVDIDAIASEAALSHRDGE